MSRFKAPSRRDRHGAKGAKLVGVAGAHVAAVAPPPLTDGKVRCPVCRNAVGRTLSGGLRRHADLFGAPCLNRAIGERVHLDVVPEVVIPPEPVPPKSRGAKGRPSTSIDGNNLLRKPITGSCHDCGKAIPPGRRLCGRCFATGDYR